MKQRNPHIGFARASGMRRRAIRVCIIAVLVLSYVFVTMPPLRFQTVEVRASTPAGTTALQEAIERFLNARSLWIFPNRSVLLFRADHLRQQLEQSLPVSTVTITTGFRRRELDVTATYRIPAARVEHLDAVEYIDGTGRALTQLLEPYDEHDLLVIRDAQQHTKVPSLNVNTADLGNYQTLRAYFKKINNPILWMITPMDPDTLNFQMNGGWTLSTSRGDRVASIIKRLDVFFDDRQRTGRHAPLASIDLRFGDKVVYTEKTSK